MEKHFNWVSAKVAVYLQLTDLIFDNDICQDDKSMSTQKSKLINLAKKDFNITSVAVTIIRKLLNWLF